MQYCYSCRKCSFFLISSIWNASASIAGCVFEFSKIRKIQDEFCDLSNVDASDLWFSWVFYSIDNKWKRIHERWWKRNTKINGSRASIRCSVHSHLLQVVFRHRATLNHSLSLLLALFFLFLTMTDLYGASNWFFVSQRIFARPLFTCFRFDLKPSFTIRSVFFLFPSCSSCTVYLRIHATAQRENRNAGMATTIVSIG